MNYRRCNKNEIDLYVIIVFLSITFHLNFIVDEKNIYDLSNISWMLITYIGYKFGKLYGLIGGTTSCLIWILYLYFSDKSNNHYYQNLIFGERYIYDSSMLSINILPANLTDFQIKNFSFQYIILYSLIGYFSGYIVDKIEYFLHTKNSSIDILLPRVNFSFILSINQWITKTSKYLYLIQIDPEDKKGFIYRRIRKLFVIFFTIPVISILWTTTFQVSKNCEIFTLVIINYGLSSLIIIWISYIYGAKIGILLSLSLTLHRLIEPYIEIVTYKFGFKYFTDQFSISNIISLTVIAWIVGSISQKFKNDFDYDKKFLIDDKRLYVPIYACFVIFILSSKYTYISTEFAIEFCPYIILAQYVLYLSKRYNYTSASNSIVVVCFFSSLIHFKYAPLDNIIYNNEIDNIASYTFIAIIPFIVKLIYYINMQKILFKLIFILSSTIQSVLYGKIGLNSFINFYYMNQYFEYYQYLPLISVFCLYTIYFMIEYLNISIGKKK